MRKKTFISLSIVILLLTGCWDQRLLVNRTLVNGVSFDVTEEGNMTAAVRALYIKNMGGGQFELIDELVKAQRPTIAGLGIDLDSKITGEIDTSKAYVLIIGEELAKKGIHPIIEFFYRQRDSYLSSKIVISKGTGYDILSVEKEKSPIAFVILKILQGAEKDTTIPKKTTFTVWNNLLDPGRDMIIPYLEKEESDKVQVAGVALFNGDQYTGVSLSKEKSSLLLAMMNQFGNTNRMALILGSENNKHLISFTTRDLKRNLEVKVKDDKVICKIDLKLNIDVLSFPQDFNKQLNIKKLNQELSDELTKQAKEITSTLLESNCDALGVGRQIASFHPELWKKVNWEEEYKKVQFEPELTVNIIKTGNVY